METQKLLLIDYLSTVEFLCFCIKEVLLTISLNWGSFWRNKEHYLCLEFIQYAEKLARFFSWPDVSFHLLPKIYRNYKQTRKQAQQVFPFYFFFNSAVIVTKYVFLIMQQTLIT